MKALIIVAALIVFCLGFWLGYSIKVKLYLTIIDELGNSGARTHELYRDFLNEFIEINERVYRRRPGQANCCPNCGATMEEEVAENV